MIAEELKVVIRAEVDDALRKLKEYKDTTKEATTSWDKFKSSMANVRDVMQGPIAAFEKAIQVIGKVIDVTKELYNAYAEAERGMIVFDNAVKQSMTVTSAQGEKIVALANSIQAMGIAEADATVAYAANLIQMGRSYDQIKLIIEAAKEYSAATGTDIVGAMELLNRTLDGNENGLRRNIGGLKDMTEEQLKAGDRIVEIADKFKGSAESIETSSANIAKKVGDNFGDLIENIGRDVSKVAKPVLSFFDELIGKANTAYLLSNTLSDIKEGKKVSIDDIKASIAEAERQAKSANDFSYNVFENTAKGVANLTSIVLKGKTVGAEYLEQKKVLEAQLKVQQDLIKAEEAAKYWTTKGIEDEQKMLEARKAEEELQLKIIENDNLLAEAEYERQKELDRIAQKSAWEKLETERLVTKEVEKQKEKYQDALKEIDKAQYGEMTAIEQDIFDIEEKIKSLKGLLVDNIFSKDEISRVNTILQELFKDLAGKTTINITGGAKEGESQVDVLRRELESAKQLVKDYNAEVEKYSKDASERIVSSNVEAFGKAKQALIDYVNTTWKGFPGSIQDVLGSIEGTTTYSELKKKIESKGTSLTKNTGLEPRFNDMIKAQSAAVLVNKDAVEKLATAKEKAAGASAYLLEAETKLNSAIKSEKDKSEQIKATESKKIAIDEVAKSYKALEEYIKNSDIDSAFNFEGATYGATELLKRLDEMKKDSTIAPPQYWDEMANKMKTLQESIQEVTDEEKKAADETKKLKYEMERLKDLKSTFWSVEDAIRSLGEAVVDVFNGIQDVNWTDTIWKGIMSGSKMAYDMVMDLGDAWARSGRQGQDAWSSLGDKLKDYGMQIWDAINKTALLVGIQLLPTNPVVGGILILASGISAFAQAVVGGSSATDPNPEAINTFDSLANDAGETASHNSMTGEERILHDYYESVEAIRKEFNKITNPTQAQRDQLAAAEAAYLAEKERRLAELSPGNSGGGSVIIYEGDTSFYTTNTTLVTGEAG